MLQIISTILGRFEIIRMGFLQRESQFVILSNKEFRWHLCVDCVGCA